MERTRLLYRGEQTLETHPHEQAAELGDGWVLNGDFQFFRQQQKTLDKVHRLENAEGKYRLNDRIKDIDGLRQRRIIVVDDIITTMSTMNSALDCLRDNGFRDICGASWLAEL